MEMEMEARGGAEDDFALERGWAWAWWECCICGRIQFSCIVLCSVRSTSVIISWQLHLMPARHDMAWDGMAWRGMVSPGGSVMPHIPAEYVPVSQ